MNAKLAALAAVLGLVAASMVATAAPPDTLDTAKPGTFPLEEIKAWLDKPGVHDPYVPKAPVGLGDIADKIPEDNPVTQAKVELGRQLYFDKRLSRDGTVSCATCHDPAKGWTDNAPVSTGIKGQKGGRSAPTVLNRVLHPTQFWDGRAATLEEQALGPIGNPIEMGFTVEEAVELLNGIEGYRIQFEKIFGGPATADGIAKAIATFERTVMAGASPWDYAERARAWEDFEVDEDTTEEDKKTYEEVMAAAKAHPMSEAAKRGDDLFFNKAECTTCHTGANFSDELYYNIGIGWTDDASKLDKGREDHTKDEKDRGAFRTPTVRNVADTGPYMHDGSLKTLREVVEHYNDGGHPNPHQSDRIRKLGLTDQEIDDVVEFMKQGLQGVEVTKVETPRLP